MNLIIVVFISLLLSFIFAWWFKRKLILLLTITLPSIIILEILITKNISAFYYRYYYHWLFLIPILLALPFSFIKEKKNRSAFLIIIFLVWGYLLIRFPVMSILQNIKYLNTDSMWFDSFSRKYAIGQVNIYDYIDWRYPKTKGIIKWCENQKSMTNLYYSYIDQIYDDNENGLHAFLINCNLLELRIEKNKSVDETFADIFKYYNGAYYLSSEKCQHDTKKFFANAERLKRYELDQKLICSAKEMIPYLYIIR